MESGVAFASSRLLSGSGLGRLTWATVLSHPPPTTLHPNPTSSSQSWLTWILTQLSLVYIQATQLISRTLPVLLFQRFHHTFFLKCNSEQYFLMVFLAFWGVLIIFILFDFYLFMTRLVNFGLLIEVYHYRHLHSLLLLGNVFYTGCTVA